MGQILDVAIAARGLALAATVFAIGKIRQNRTHRAPAPHRRVTAARRMNSPIAAYAAASLKWSERRDLNSRPPVPQTVNARQHENTRLNVIPPKIRWIL